MQLVALPAFTDNYIWMLHDGRHALVVDPGEAAPVDCALESLGLELAGILVTHHHADHVGGLEALRPRLRGPVYGPATESIPGPCLPRRDGDTAELLGLSFQVIDVPGHTAGHIAYWLPADDAIGAPILFCGDTLFSAGCGRIFEGTPAQLHASLLRLAALPGDTRVCCAHEYTLSNLKFAVAADPVNPTRDAYLAWCEAQRARQQPTLPSTIAQERAVNPFLRCGEPEVVRTARAQGADSADGPAVFAALRSWKNHYR